MGEQMTGGLARGFRAAMALLLAVALSLPAGALNVQAYADEPMQIAAATGAQTQALGGDESEIKIAVLSDMHYYPVNFVSDCEDYETYVGGDPKMLEESGSIADAALQMVREDNPDILLVSGDLTKDGEIQGHRDLASKFQKLEDETDIEVFVINGNHDLYNYTDACTFENGQKESAETTEQDDFKTIYANFGYNGDYSAQYFENPNAAQGELAGQMSYTVDLGKFRIVAIDSCCYSPDGGNGMGTNEHITAGRIDEGLMPWVVGQIKDAEKAGDTVIGLMHHGVVPHFQGEEDLLYEYVVDDWQNVATQFADAGMRYVFTGHMHANDITQYTSVSGNTITDLETGSLSSWMSPQRHVTITKGEALSDGTNRTKESFSVTSHSVKSIDFTDHNGQTQHIEDFRAYTQQKLYPETLFNNMANGMLRPILQEIGETGIRPWLAENLPDVDIDTMVLDVARDALAGGMEIELGTGVGRVSVSYRNNGIQLQPSGTAGWALDDMTITDDQILRLVDDVLDIVETKYIENPDWLLGEVDKIVTKVSNMGITSLTDEEHSIYDLVLVVLTGHYAGSENPPAWVESALAYIKRGEIVQNLIDTLKTDLMPIINTLLADNSIDTGIAFSGLWKTAIDAVTDDGNLKETLDLFGFDEAAISELIDGLINEYLTPSFLTGMGSLISDVASSMLYDVNFIDDVIDGGDAVVIEFDGSKNAPAASVENGLLPTQVTMTLGADSENSRNFRWYTGLNVDSGTVQVATDSGFSSIVAEADASREEVVKPKTRMNLGLITTYGTQEAAKYSASVTGLDDGATYYYRVGDKEANLWSAVYQFTTGDAADGDDAFTFINVNDSQGMVESDYDVYLNTLAQADATFPTAAFTIHAGDFVDDGANEDYWTWALDDANGVAQGMAMTPAAGNHEAKSEVEGITDANPIVSHYNLANVPQGQDLSTGVYYSYVYKNATFVVLNTNDLSGNELSSAQYSWAYDTLANADTEWKIVLMHKSPYSNGPHQADDDVLAIRSQINSLAAATDVDVVLSGHDHVYNRTPYLAHGNEQNVTTETQNYEGVNYETALNPSGTVFVIAGTCGVKNYVQTPSDSIPSKVSLDLSVPVFTGITIDGDHLYYRAYKVEGGGSVLVDSFAISKAEEDAAPAWKQVEDMIAALPEQSEVTTDDKAAIEAARVAYDELSAEDQQKVSNYDRLVAAERMLSLLQTVAGKRTVTVRNHDEFTSAVNDSGVGTIITQGTIEFDEGGLFDDGDREIYVRHDVVVRGTGELKYCRFHVENGATLVLADSVYVNDTRSQGSMYDALNPVEVNAGGTLITQGSVSLRTEYGTGGSDEGFAVKLMDSGATAILGSSGTYWGAEGAVLSEATGTTLVINDGTYNAKNNNRVVVDTHGDATVNGGTISSMWISGTLRVNGGTFEHQDSASSNWTPLAVSGGNAYITGGTFSAYGGRDGNASIKLENNAKLHVLADTNGAVNIGSATPYVGSPSTSDYKNVKLGYVKSNGWNSSDGVYRVEGSVSASSVEDIAGLSASRLDTKDVANNGNYMETVLPDGTSTVFGKYWIYGGNGGKGAPSGSGIIGRGDVIVYGPTRTIQNNPVTGVTIDGDDRRVVDLREEGAGTLRLNGYTTPADAFDNGITWSSNNEQTASVEAVAGQGVVSLKIPGGATITATSDSKPDLSDSVEIIAVEPSFADTVEEIAWNQDKAIIEASAGFPNDTYKDRISFEYSTDNNSIATFEPEVDPETGKPVSELEPGTLRKISRGMVKVTAELLVNSEPTGITVSKDVFCDAAPEAPTYGELAELLDVTVADGNEAMAAEHAAQRFDLIENASEQTDSYSVGAVSASDQAPANPIDALANFMGLDNARSVWTVDVTVNAAPYAKAFDEKLELAADTHTVDEGDAQKTVKLVWNIGDDQADPTAETGWALENEDASPVQFQAKCTSHKVDFKYVGEDWASIAAPEPVNVLAGAEIGDKLPTPEREGFTFVGWYKDWDETDGFKDENLVTGASTVGADTMLYGRWAVGAQAMNAYVVFDPSGGAFAEDDETPEVVRVELTSGVDHVDTKDVPADPSLANHVFAGWYYKAVSEGGVELPFKASATEIVGNLHVYAKWNEKPQVEIAAGDNDFTYNGEAQAFQFSVKSDDVDANSFTVEYRPADSDDDRDWSSQTVPTDAGEYDVRITRDEDKTYASFEQVIESAVKIGKASQAMPELAVQGGAESAIIKVSGDAANVFEWDDNERFESAADVSDGAVPAAGPGTYFVRAKEADNHAAGAIAQVSVVKVDFSAGEGSLPETTHNAWLIGAGQAVGEDGMPADPTREGYEFAGWKMGEADFDAGTVVSQSASVAAAWTAKTFTVNFDADGGVFEGDEGAPITVTYDKNWPELSTPTKTGMNFNGWWLGEGEDAVWVIAGTPVKITDEVTLKARWTDKTAIVVTVGQENEFVYDGVEHSFSYTTDPEGVEMTVEYRPAAGESDEDWSPALPVDAGAYDVRLTHVEDETYAEFSAAIGHVLVIDKADQTLPEQFFSASTFGDYVLVTFSSADMVGNLEWANNEGFVDAAEVTQGDTFEVRSEGAYYLRFKGDANHNPSPSASFTVVKATFDVGEGVLSQGDKAAWLIQSGTTLGGNLPEASREGYRFDGWFAGETQIGAETQINDSIAAAAKWTANTYQLAFDADGDGQADDGIAPMTVTYDSAYGELPVPVAQAGKIFEGWLLDGMVVSAEDTVKITENTLLTAKWTDKREIAVLPDADVNKAYVYGDEGIVFKFDATEGTMPERFEILYGDAEQNTWDEAAPVNAGTYDVKVTYAEDEAFKAFERVFDDALTIAKADQTMSELSVTAGSDGATVSFEPAEGAGYERADNAEFDDAQPVEGGTFQATEPGTWYVRAKGDANHEPGEAAGVQIAKVTFDAASGTVEGSVAWFLKSGESVGEGNLPTATREGFEFGGWTVDGEPFDGTTPVIGDIIAIAGWSEVGDEPGPDEPQAPAAPVADEVATLEGVTVTLNGVNEINSDEGNKTHPDVTFASVGEDVQPLIAKSFTIGQPAETDGVWTVEVTMDAQKYLDAYAAMGDPAYGAHYFANADEDGVGTFALTYDADARAWVLADAQQAAFAYDITCLTLRPAEAEIYTGGTSENGGHFIDQYVVDGQGNVVSIDELNERLDEGVTASIKYYDADGNEVTDDTVAGHYIARIDVSAAEEQARAAAIDDTVEVNVGGREYTFNLEPSELVIRSVSDAAEAERGDLNVALVDGSDAQAVATALGQAQGGVVAALPGETTILFNGDPEVEIADRSDITLLSDDLLPGGREDALLARVQEVLGADALADNTDFQYLDLVDRSQSNAWVSSTAGTQVFWRIPEGADIGSIKILHFVDLHRDYTMADEDIVDLIAGCDVEAMSLTFDEENGFVSFAVPEGGFSPFLMTWNDAVDDPDQPGTDPDQPGTDPDDPGADPDQPGADPEDPDQPAQKVTVTFDANGGQLSTGTPGSVEIAAGGTIAMLPQPVRTGYAFVGWTTADGTAFGITTPVNESMTVIAQWTPNVYQISLDAQGGALAADEASIEATFDAPIGQLPVPTREGYEFLGWFTQPQGGDEVAAETMYRTAGPSTYYAQWDVLPATQVVLTLDANGGMFQGGQETIAEVVAINAPLHGSDLTVPQREGFELAGWYLDESLTQPVVLVEDADPDAGIVATTFAQDATLYAKWLEDLSSDADISFGGILQAYTGSAMPAVPTFGESFPNDERAKVQVLYRASLMRANEWTDQAPVNVGTYDVRFVYEGSGEYAAFAKDYPAGITITKATLAQVGLTVDTSEVEAGTKLADVSLEGATVTSQVTGAVIEGIWAWLDADGVVDETGAYQAVFVPADVENFEPLHVEIQLTVKEAGADEPGGSDKPTEPTDPGLPGTDSTDPDNQPGAGTGTDTGSGSGTGAGAGAGAGTGSDGADGRNQMKLVATGDPVAGMIVGFGAVLLAALITGLAALRNTRRKN